MKTHGAICPIAVVGRQNENIVLGEQMETERPSIMDELSQRLIVFQSSNVQSRKHCVFPTSCKHLETISIVTLAKSTSQTPVFLLSH